MGRPDENLSMEFICPLSLSTEETLQKKRILSVSLQKGQLKANVCYHPQHSANLEVPALAFFLDILFTWYSGHCTNNLIFNLWDVKRCGTYLLMNWSLHLYEALFRR